MIITSDVAIYGKCNLSCRFCREKNVPSLDYDKIIETIYEVKKISSSITLTGGEPTLCPDFFRILDFCLDNFSNVSILSNLKSFGDARFYNSLLERDCSKISIITSLDSHIEKMHDFLCGYEYYRDKIDMIDRVYSSNFKDITIGIVINKYNLNNLSEWYDFVISKWNKANIFFKVYNSHGAPDDVASEFLPKYQDIGKLVSQFDTYQVFNMPLCFLQNIEFHSIEYYLIKEFAPKINGINELRKIFPKNVFHEKCEGCIHYRYCLGIDRSYFMLYGDDDFLPVKDINLDLEKK